MRRLTTLTIIFGMSALLAISSLAGVVQAETPEPEDAPATEEPTGPKLSMVAVGTQGGYFEFDAEPGERLVMNFELVNTGDTDGTAIIYAADAYTMVNGGFDARQLADSRTGPTEWLDFTSDVVEVGAEQELVKTVTLDVPDDIEPGEHMTALVMQDRDPDQESTERSDSEGGIHIEYVSRHAIPVFITIPEATDPGLGIGEAEHALAGGNSAAKIEVNNPGNIRVLPETGGFILEDENKGVSASAERIPFHVPEPETIGAEDGGITGLIQPPRLPGDGGSGSWWTLLGIIAAVALLAAIIGVLIGRRRARANAAAISSDPDIEPEPVSAPAAAAPTTVQPAAQSVTTTQPAAPSRKPGGLKPLLPKRQMD